MSIVSDADGVLALGRKIVPNSFEEKLAKDLRVCPSTGKAVSISYHTFGDPAHPMLLLIPGLNAQSVTNYDSATCTWLAQQGFYVVRMDNRDVGLSTKFDDVHQRLIMPMFLLPNWMAIGERQPYTLDDMADDASALIRHLAPGRKVHVLGVSMGGMIAQIIALRNPELLLSLTLVMTNSGNAKVAPASLKTLLKMLRKPKSDSVEHINEYRRWYIENILIGAPLKDTTCLELIEKEFTRNIYMKGAIRHMAAISRAPSRDAQLAKIDLPTHVVHGERDMLVPVGNGRHLHKLIPNSKLSIYPEMGHYVDSDHSQKVLEEMVAFIRPIR